MEEIRVPGPEADWQPATQPGYYTGNNPAYQQGMWCYAASTMRVVGGVSVPLEAMAERLRLTVERSWDDLDVIDAALFRIQRIHFALSCQEGNSCRDVWIWVDRAQEDEEAALDILFGALGIGREALTFRRDGEGGFVDLRGQA